MSESPYHSSLLAASVGGIQWGLSAAAVALVWVNLYVDYVIVTESYAPNGPVGPGPLPIVAALAGGALAGALWTTLRTEGPEAEIRDTRRRVEFLALFLAFPVLLLLVSTGWTILQPVLPPLPSTVSLLMSQLRPVIYWLGGLWFASMLVYRQGFDRLTDWRSYTP
jgi:hypothetical protein